MTPRDVVSGRLPATPADLQQPLPAVENDLPVAERETTPRETSAAELPVTWYGRWPSISANGPPHVWLPEKVPAGLTPWTWPAMPWTPADIWLPHPPVRGRAK